MQLPLNDHKNPPIFQHLPLLNPDNKSSSRVIILTYKTFYIKTCHKRIGSTFCKICFLVGYMQSFKNNCIWIYLWLWRRETYRGNCYGFPFGSNFIKCFHVILKKSGRLAVLWMFTITMLQVMTIFLLHVNTTPIQTNLYTISTLHIPI